MFFRKNILSLKLENMKIFIYFIILIAISRATPFDDDLDTYKPLSYSEIRSSLVSDLINYGVDQILMKMEQDNEIFTANDFYLGDVQEGWKRRDGRVINYKFSVILDNDNINGLYIEANFQIEYQPFAGGRRIIRYYEYSFNYDETPEEENDYSVIPRSRYNDRLINNLMNYGIDQVLLKARGLSQIPNKNFYLSGIQWIESRRAGSITYYKYNVELEDSNRESRLSSIFIVMYLPSSGSKEVVDVESNYEEIGTGREENSEDRPRGDSSGPDFSATSGDENTAEPGNDQGSGQGDEQNGSGNDNQDGNEGGPAGPSGRP